MLITQDRMVGDVDRKLVNHGYGKIVVHSLKIGVYYTKEQLDENVRTRDILSPEDWLKGGEDYRIDFHKKVLALLNRIHEKHYLYQFEQGSDTNGGRDRYRSGDYDLFFYSNKGWNGKDYFDYVSLTVNDKKTDEENALILADVIQVLESADISCASCCIQYHAVLDRELINCEVRALYDKVGEKLLTQYHGVTGKLKMMDSEHEEGRVFYGFFKKGSRKRYYPVETEYLLFKTL